MASSSRSGHGHENDDAQRSRLTPRAPETPASGERADTGQADDAGTGGGNLLGSHVAGSPAPGGPDDHGGRAEEGADGRTRADPIGSALADAHGRRPQTPDAAAGAGNNPSSGSHSLGATTGGERASAGRADANRSSRDDDNSREG